MMKKTRRKIDAVTKVKIYLEAFREQATVAEQLHENAARAFDAGIAWREREVEKLHAKIGQVTVERDFLAKGSGR